jgi:hypothetical protein
MKVLDEDAITNFHKLLKQRVCHTLALPFKFKSIIGQKEKSWEHKLFHHAKTLSSKNPLKETKIRQGIITL